MLIQSSLKLLLPQLCCRTMKSKFSHAGLVTYELVLGSSLVDLAHVGAGADFVDPAFPDLCVTFKILSWLLAEIHGSCLCLHRQQGCGCIRKQAINVVSFENSGHKYVYASVRARTGQLRKFKRRCCVWEH